MVTLYLIVLMHSWKDWYGNMLVSEEKCFIKKLWDSKYPFDLIYLELGVVKILLNYFTDFYIQYLVRLNQVG